MTGVWVRLLHIPALLTVGLRLLIAFAGSIPVLMLSRERRSVFASTLRQGDAWTQATLLVLYYVCAVAAFQYTTVAEGSLFIGTSPAFVLLTKLARRAPIERRERTGAAIAFAGVLFVLLPKILFPEAHSVTAHSELLRRLGGDLFALSAAATSAAYAARFRDLHERGKQIDAITIGTVASIIGGLGLTVVMYFARPAAFAALQDSQTVSVLLALGLLSTAIPQVTYAIASHILPAIVSTTSQLMIPVVATVGAAFILHELPNWNVYAGGALIAYGIVHMFRKNAPPVEEGEAPLSD